MCIFVTSDLWFMAFCSSMYPDFVLANCLVFNNIGCICNIIMYIYNKIMVVLILWIVLK